MTILSKKQSTNQYQHIQQQPQSNLNASLPIAASSASTSLNEESSNSLNQLSHPTDNDLTSKASSNENASANNNIALITKNNDDKNLSNSKNNSNTNNDGSQTTIQSASVVIGSDSKSTSIVSEEAKLVSDSTQKHSLFDPFKMGTSPSSNSLGALSTVKSKPVESSLSDSNMTTVPIDIGFANDSNKFYHRPQLHHHHHHHHQQQHHNQNNLNNQSTITKQPLHQPHIATQAINIKKNKVKSKTKRKLGGLHNSISATSAQRPRGACITSPSSAPSSDRLQMQENYNSFSNLSDTLAVTSNSYNCLTACHHDMQNQTAQLSDTFVDTLRYSSNNSNISEIAASSNETDISDSSGGEVGDCGGAGTSSSSENLSDRSSSVSNSGYLAQNDNDAYDPLLTIDSTRQVRQQTDSLIMGQINETDAVNLIYDKYKSDELKYFREKERDKEYRSGKKPSNKLKNRTNIKHKYKNGEFGMNRESMVRKSNNDKQINFDLAKSNQLLVNSANSSVAPILASSTGSTFNFEIGFNENGKKLINKKNNLSVGENYNEEYLNNNSEDEYDYRPLNSHSSNSNLKANNQFMQQHTPQLQVMPPSGPKNNTKNSINNNNNKNNNNLLLNYQTIEEV
jgi:hypothetical protein